MKYNNKLNAEWGLRNFSIEVKSSSSLRTGNLISAISGLLIPFFEARDLIISWISSSSECFFYDRQPEEYFYIQVFLHDLQLILPRQEYRLQQYST